jgi:hypothetical protein
VIVAIEIVRVRGNPIKAAAHALLVGIDDHSTFQLIAVFIEETDEYAERELNHSNRRIGSAT